MTIALLSLSMVLLFLLCRERQKKQLFKKRLVRKDQIIHMLIRALPMLFVENYKDPDYNKERDGSFAFHSNTRPEYDGRFIEVKWICNGVDKNRYNSLVIKYFKLLETMGLDVHPVLLGDRPYAGRVMLESYYDFDEDEIATKEESEQSVRKIGNV